MCLHSTQRCYMEPQRTISNWLFCILFDFGESLSREMNLQLQLNIIATFALKVIRLPDVCCLLSGNDIISLVIRRFSRFDVLFRGWLSQIGVVFAVWFVCTQSSLNLPDCFVNYMISKTYIHILLHIGVGISTPERKRRLESLNVPTVIPLSLSVSIFPSRKSNIFSLN